MTQKKFAKGRVNVICWSEIWCTSHLQDCLKIRNQSHGIWKKYSPASQTLDFKMKPTNTRKATNRSYEYKNSATPNRWTTRQIFVQFIVAKLATIIPREIQRSERNFSRWFFFFFFFFFFREWNLFRDRIRSWDETSFLEKLRAWKDLNRENRRRFEVKTTAIVSSPAVENFQKHVARYLRWFNRLVKLARAKWWTRSRCYRSTLWY